MAEPIRSVCPKCGREGTQNINVKGNAKYLRFVHGSQDVCYIGRIRRPGEGLGLLNKPQSIEEYEKATKDITTGIRGLLKEYSGSDIGSVKRMCRILDEILMSYGY